MDAVYDGAGSTYELYREEYGRNSIDDRGMEIIQTVHFGQAYQNAFWNGEQMVYGDGDGSVFGNFTSDIDVIGHELSHGVTQHEAGLVYEFQSGALNEHFSDVFGSLVKQRAANEDAKTANWLMGENVIVGKKYVLRSLKAPGTAYVNHPVLGTDPQPATMDDFQELPLWDDQGGVHINSGIPNHAFYLAAIELGGYAWKKAGLVWYRTLCDLLGENATFVRAAQATVQAGLERREGIVRCAVRRARDDARDRSNSNRVASAGAESLVSRFRRGFTRRNCRNPTIVEELQLSACPRARHRSFRC